MFLSRQLGCESRRLGNLVLKAISGFHALTLLYCISQKVDGSNLQVAIFLAGCQHLIRTLFINLYTLLLYRHDCFTGKYTTRKINKNYIRDASGILIFHNLTREFINNVILVISLFYFIDVILSI